MLKAALKLTLLPIMISRPKLPIRSGRLLQPGLMRLFIAITAVLAALAAPSACAEFSSRGVVHTVFLWLQQPGDEQHRRRLLSATNQLRTIPGVREIRFGEMIESDRAIVDDSFDVGIYFYFDDVGAMNAYLVHPLHKTVVEREIKPLVRRIVVHDFHDVVVAD